MTRVSGHFSSSWRGRLWLFSWAVTSIFGGQGFAAETYLVTDLGSLGGPSSQAHAINNAGNVAGVADLMTGSFHAVLLSNNVLTDLGTLGGTNSAAYSLSESNHVVGWSSLLDREAPRAFLFSQGAMTDLGALLTDSTQSVARGVNRLGSVVGEYQTARGQTRPFVYANGMIPLGFNGVANCINDSGQIGGYEIREGKVGFIISGAERQEVGTLGSNDTEVVHINTNGLAVGRSLTLQGVYHAFGFEGGAIHGLGTLGGSSSEAFGVNSAGHIVGRAQDKQGQWRAFLYRKGSMFDLNEFLPPESGWRLAAARGINDSGQIVGTGELQGRERGFLLTPNYLELALYPGLVVRGRVGRSYRIDYLDALSPTNSWQTLTNFVLPASPFFVVDPRPVVFANRVYRSVLLP